MPTTTIMDFSSLKLVPFLNPEDARLLAVKLTASVELAAGTVLGEVTATGAYDAYGDAGAGGLDVARLILAVDVVVDGSGLVTYTDTSGQAGGEFGQKHASAPAYYKGVFSCADLTGLTAAAVADLGRLIKGDASTGVLAMF